MQHPQQITEVRSRFTLHLMIGYFNTYDNFQKTVVIRTCPYEIACRLFELFVDYSYVTVQIAYRLYSYVTVHISDQR